ncbi:toll/interleukin-1 receptor domain-containing protein [Geomonas sp. RF6]|uniref:toll/interleukin-1 receptor domain-containing protein n=1 Tax=Geomonas sp. RF6 TaxID=2897342 RepID=UPI001E360F52|nr:toll/interleukin-1 receptor domain-containing protein [Geomonas sp. RF6]UFS72501.1 toll/interleukin-1 receptor domain-containing protein [Geomonas sp. RF6]
MNPELPKVFISFAHKDDEWGKALKSALDTLDVPSRTDQDIRAGEDWMFQIESALDSSSVFVLLISPDFMASEWAMFEIGVALGRSRESEVKILPVLLKPSDVPDAIQRLETIDGRSVNPPEVARRIRDVVEQCSTHQ